MQSLPGIVSLICLLTVSAVDVGDPAPSLTGTTWVRGGAPHFKDQYTVVEFWSTTCKECESAVPFLSGLQKRYGEKVAVVGLSDEPLEDIAVYVGEKGDRLGYSVGKVPPEVGDRYMEGGDGVPQVFLVDREGVVVWEGHPTEMEDVLAKALAGELDVERIKRVSRLEKALRESIGTNDLKKIAGAADAILALDPVHERAMRVRGVVAKRREDPAGFRSIYDRIDVGKLSGEKAHRLAWDLVTEKDFSYRNLDIALALAEHALDREPANGAVANTYARIRYCLGNIDQAIEWQRKAVQLDPEETGFKADLDYYVKVRALSESGPKKKSTN